MTSEMEVVQERTTLAAKAQQVNLDDSFEPATFGDAMQMAQILAKAEIVPDHFKNKPADIVVALMMGRQYHIPGILMVQEGHVIKGKFGLPAIMLDALCQRHPDCELFRVVEAKESHATVEVKRRSWPDVQRMSFTIEEARRAGLLSKGGGWASNPIAMLIARARSRAARTYFAEITTGLYSVEELRDENPQGMNEKAPLTATLADRIREAKQIAAPKAPPITMEPDVPARPEPIPADDEAPLPVQPPPPAETVRMREPGEDPEDEPTAAEIGTMFSYPPVETADRPRGKGRR